MTDLSNLVALKAALQALLNNGVPDESIEPDEHYGVLEDLLDTITGLDKALRVNQETGGYDLKLTEGDLISLLNSGFQGDIVPGTLTANQTYTFQDASGVVAFLSDIGGGATNLSEGTATNTTVDINSDTGTNATIQPASTLRAGVMSKAKFDEVEANNLKVSNVSTDLSEGTATNTTVDVNSSDGTNATLGAASASRAGVMSKAKFDEVEANNSKVSNVSTDLSIGTKTISTLDVNSSDGNNATIPSFNSTEAGVTPGSGGGTTNFLRADGTWAAVGGATNLGIANITATNLDVTSDTGTDATLPTATASLSGVMPSAKFNEVVTNNAKVSNVTTNLSEGTSTTTTVDVNSSDGTNATLLAASTSRAGLMTKAKFDEIVVNNAKVSNVSTDLSIGTKTASTVDVNSSDGTNATIPSFTATESGLVPASTGGTVKFLRADGAWTDVFSTIDVGSFVTYLGANSMRLHQEVIGGIGRITWEGTTGALFTIIDDKDNELWTASDVSGNPIGYIDADWNVRFGNPFNRPFSIRHDSGTGIDYTKFVLPDYANDAAADADAALLSGESYTTSALNRQIHIKP